MKDRERERIRFENGLLTSRRGIVSADVCQRPDNGQFGRAVLLVLLVEMTMAPEQSFSDLNIEQPVNRSIAL